MNIAIIGYGKMGKLIEETVRSRGHSVSAVVDPFADGGQSLSGAPLYKDIGSAAASGAFSQCDGAIEFTRPDTVTGNIRALAERGIPLVTGTTGWAGELEDISAMVREKKASLLWSSNFSLGVNLFYRIAAFAAKKFDPFDDYDAGGWEAHHNKKADSPSGTAKTLAETVLGAMTRKKTPVWEKLDRPPAPEELHFASLRLGSVPGIHSIFFDSPADTIEITHTARNREGFAAGAVRAAEWLVSCPGPGMAAVNARQGVFTMDDVLEDILA
ncbi:4-hydroxy-tetrahydrodipicolinate reductase [Treponema sp. OttesenSCG-928-L16]|nr:4-hydroxy-tetrahydrodipicolinate reductase [Treponema sp. OttesenSCG-928-L16]